MPFPPDRFSLPKLLLAVCLCSQTPALFGQVANPPAAPSSSGADAATGANDEPVKLSPFDVSEVGDRGYGTSSGLGGTRTDQPLIEASMSINTLDSAFLNDLGFTQLRDAVDFISGMGSTGAQDDGRYSTRGQASSGSNFRDGLPETFGLNSTEAIDASLYDRVEVIKGPAGVLFGSMGIGGTVNRISKRPLPVDQGFLSESIDSWGIPRTDFDVNQLLLSSPKGTLSFRMAGAYQFGFTPDKVPDNRTALNPSVEYRTASGDELWVYFVFQADASGTLGTLPGDKVHANFITYPAPFMSYDTPLYEGTSPRWNNHRLPEIGYIKKFSFFGADSALRFVARYNYSDQDRANSANAGYNVYGPAGNLLGTNLQVQWNAVDVGSVWWPSGGLSKSEDWWKTRGETESVDFTSSFKLLGGTHKYILYAQATHALTWEYALNGTALKQAVERWPDWQLGSLTALPAPWANFLWAPVTNAKIDTNDSSHADNRAFAGQDNVYYFGNRLILTAGVRHDEEITGTHNILTAPFTYVSGTSADWSDKLGVIAQPLPWQGFSVYYNHSTTFTPVSTIDTNTSSPTYGQKFPDQIGLNDEGGMKFDLFNSRIVGTAVYFKSMETNQLEPVIAPNGNSINQPVGNITSRGEEFDFAVQATHDLDFLTSFSTLKSIASATHVAARGVPQRTFAFFGKYSISWWRPLKGLSVTGGYRFAGNRTADTAGDSKTPNLNLVNSGLIYVLNRHWRFQTTCDNLLNKLEVTGSVDQNRLDVYPPAYYTFKTTWSY